MLLISVIFCFLVSSIDARPSVVADADDVACGYQSCYPVKEGFINVHIVPHTHDDVGWLKTVEQYYYGSQPYIQKASVQNILESVVHALKKDESRRFIYVETSFFWKWWIHQDDIVKAQFRKFVENGQLEFISGGWTMNDEAVTHYQSIIDQFTWGLKKLNETFGECGQPKVGWQIDPFGHSREMASIFAQLGFDGLLLGRIDYEEKVFRHKTKSAEMVWRGSENLGSKSEIFTGILYDQYTPPSGFCFDTLCLDEPIIDDLKSPDYNVNYRVGDFLTYLKQISGSFSTDNIIITMGGDFYYEDAELWFRNLDKLIYHTNLRQENGSIYNLIYSTPSCYVKAIYDETQGKTKWLVKQDDFFPYATDRFSYWTGYFTSRPTLKRFEREGNNFLQVCKQLYALTDIGPKDEVDLDTPREAMGVLQHHDAVTGTEKLRVAYDYARILSKGMDECEIITATALSKIVARSDDLQTDEPAPVIPFTSCRLLNVSQCELTETNDSFIVTVYNPLSRPVTKFVRVPVLGTAYSVLDSNGLSLITQINPIATPILSIPGRESNATLELIFQATDIPPLGFKSYFVEKSSRDDVVKPEESVSYKLGGVEFEVDSESGLISLINMNNKTLNLAQDFLYYEGYVGDNTFGQRSSGAYIFRPKDASAYKVAEKAAVQSYKGPLVVEHHQQFSDWVSQVIRIYVNENYVEFDWLIGPIPTDGYTNGKEIITRYATPLETESTFYTDSNGREMLKRVRNFRPTWNLSLGEPVAGNYYPVTSKIVLKSDDDEIAVLTDRSQGGSSLHDGEIELMLHRKCLNDDGFGVSESLREEAFSKGLVVRGSHYVVFGSTDTNNPGGRTTAAQERSLAQEKLLSSYTFLSSTNGLNYEQYKEKYQMEFAGLRQALPDNVQILTLEPWIGTSFLLRLEHVLEDDEDPTLSQPVAVDLKNIFSVFEITSLQETTLGANQWLSENNRLEFETGGSIEDLVRGSNATKGRTEDSKKWNYKNCVEDENSGKTFDDVDNLIITLDPMQIRTFVIETTKSVKNEMMSHQFFM